MTTPGSSPPIHTETSLWLALAGWLKQHTAPAPWLPPRLRHPVMAYLAALLLELLAGGLILLVQMNFSPFVFPGALLTLVIVLVALNWGEGPSLLATFLGAVMLVVISFPPFSAWELDDPLDWLDLGLYGAVGVAVSLLTRLTGQARRKAEHSAREAAFARKQMETFLGIASHELKTPLTTLTLHLDRTRRRLARPTTPPADGTASTEEQVQLHQEDLSQMRQHLRRLERVVNDLVEASRLQAGRMDLRLERVNLATLVRDVVAEHRQANEERTIHVSLPTGQVVPVLADALRVEQALINYLSNALKYSSDEQPVEVGLALEAHQARVWVRDKGPGIPLKEQERIWERFHRVPGVEVQSGSGIGLGLGLSICREIIERHQGQVGVQSTPGEGSTFWFTLPLASSQTAPDVSA